MEIDRKRIKDTAKQNLISNLGICILVLGILPQIVSIISGEQGLVDIIVDKFKYGELNIVFILVGSILSYILAVGISKVALNIARYGKAKVSDMQEVLKVSFKAILLGILVTLVIIIGTVLCIIPGVIATYTLYFSFYILVDNPSKSVIDCMKESAELTKGYRDQLFILDLSFALWYILSFVTLGLANLWVSPYKTLTESEFYLELLKQKEKTIE